MGEGDPRIVLHSPVLGPFHAAVAELMLPARLARDISAEPQQSVVPDSVGSGLLLTLTAQSSSMTA